MTRKYCRNCSMPLRPWAFTCARCGVRRYVPPALIWGTAGASTALVLGGAVAAVIRQATALPPSSGPVILEHADQSSPIHRLVAAQRTMPGGHPSAENAGAEGSSAGSSGGGDSSAGDPGAGGPITEQVSSPEDVTGGWAEANDAPVDHRFVRTPATDVGRLRRDVVDALVRRGLVDSVVPVGQVIRVAIGPTFHRLSRATRDPLVKALYLAYADSGAPLALRYLELWDGPRKIGEYVRDTFYFGPRYATPR